MPSIRSARGWTRGLESSEWPCALSAARDRRAGTAGLIVLVDPTLIAYRKRIIDFVAQHRVPTMYTSYGWAEQGGLMEYTPDTRELYSRAAIYVDRILRGAKPGDLPVEQPTKFELVINLKTAKALGLTIPQTLLLQASQLIE